MSDKNGSNIGLSMMNSQQILNSHIKSIMPSLRGGKKEDQIKYIHIRVQQSLNAEKNLEDKIRQIMVGVCGEFYDYDTFKDKQKIMEEEVTDKDLYYIFLKQQLASWGEKFVKQQYANSEGTKSYFIVQFLRNHKYAQKIEQRKKQKQKNRRDANENFVYFINSDGEYIQEMKNHLMIDMNNKLNNKLRREGNRVKTWALKNKYKQKKPKRERLYIYIEDILKDKLAGVYKRFRKRNGFKWTQLKGFSTFQEILKDVKKRQQEFIAQDNLKSSISINPASKIFDRSQSGIKSYSNINGFSALSKMSNVKSVKNLILDKTQNRLGNNDKNFIIHSEDFFQTDKIYQYVMSQKENNWQRVIYEDKNYLELNQLMQKVEAAQKQNQNDLYLNIIKAHTLYIVTYNTDYEIASLYNSQTNNFNNRYLLDYQNQTELLAILTKFARNQDDFMIVIIQQQGSDYDRTVLNFIQKNRNIVDCQNMLIKYKRHQLNESLSMNSKVSNVDEQIPVQKYIKAVIQDRDRHFNPFDCYANNYVYILTRIDKSQLLDQQLRKRISQSARLKQTTYQDANYLQQFLITLERGKDHAIILTDDGSLREAQQVAKKFNKVQIMNITSRKNVKDEVKVLVWGEPQVIKEAIFNISQKQKVEKRSDYKQVKEEIFMQNPIPRRMPKNIEFKQGNNITIKMSHLQTHPDSQIMEQNLNQYFKQQIRFQYYQKPKQIRLVNKNEQPLTFIICRDNPEQLEYMKNIAKQQRDDLRQQYIIYSQNPRPLFNSLFNNDQRYDRFRFISNSWKKIQQYIIGVYQTTKGNKNQINDQIYEDQTLHLFYTPEDTHLYQLYNHYNNNSDLKIWNNIRLHSIRDLQLVALQQSPHHIYYVLVDQIAGHLNEQQALSQIQRVEGVLSNRRVAPKKIKMLLINQKPGAMRDRYVQGTFDNGQQAMNYISNTGIISPNYEINKPHIIIDKNSSDWFYFLNKHEYRDRYVLHYIDNIEQSIKLIESVRTNEVGSQFWYISSNFKNMTKFVQLSNYIEQGRRIYGVFHGNYPAGISQNKIIFAHPQREQIQAFILNAHKRSQTIFSPQSLRKKPPILAISKVSKVRIPIDERQIAKWKQDLGAQQKIFDHFSELTAIPRDRNIFWIADIEQQTFYKNQKQNLPNIWRIIFDSNQNLRKKSHKLINIFPNSRQTYYGHYPAQIRHYLRYLRYNMKNSPQKLRSIYSNQLTNLYLQKQLTLNQKQVENILKTNHSIVKVFFFQSNKASIQNAINHALTNPNYNNIFIFDKSMESVLNQIPNRNRVKYLMYDQKFRFSGSKNAQTQLLTDQKPQYITYINNLPQNRYLQAKNFRSKNPLKLFYLSNGNYDKYVQQLKLINKRNPNFVLVPYQNISDLRNVKENIIVLTDLSDYDRHLQELKNVQNIKYFIIGNDNLRITRNLISNPSRSEFFVTKQDRQIKGFFNNLMRNPQISGPLNFPTLSLPSFIDSNKNKNLKSSRTIKFNSNIDLNSLKFFPPFKKTVAPPIIPPPLRNIYFNETNFIDQPNQQFFNIPLKLTTDSTSLTIQNFQKYRHLLSKNVQPLKLTLDRPLMIDQKLFMSKPDTLGYVPQLKKPTPKTIQTKLALVHPQNKQFRQIFKVLQSNLCPKSFTKVQSFPYSSDYDFKNLYKNENKFMGFDRTVIFLTPSMAKYQNQLRQIKRKMNGKAEYYYFSDDFNNYYDGFKKFLSPYTIRNQQIPYINREQPKFWLTTTLYNVMVPLSKKKRYDSIKRNNVLVLPYTSQDDIQNQLHRNQEFVIIVCDKKDYHKFKKFTRMSPRCIIVIEDSQQLKQDEVPLFRYPSKVLYYGPDALNYLSKTRIPNKLLPFKNQGMKVLFFNQNNSQQRDYVLLDDFDDYEKVPYTNSQDLFIKLIENFKNSSNFKLPPNLGAKDLIKLHPKVYIQKQISYMNKYFNEYSSFSGVHQRQYKQSFNSIIKPEQYKHLHIKQYESSKDLRQMLQMQQTPCLVYLDQNIQQNLKLEHDYKKKHLFIMMFDLLDMWIDRNGYLIQPQKLNRQQLAVKQTLFTTMFNCEVFDTYNDMGYFYLSNTAHLQKERRIHFMTKQALVQKFKSQPNLLMVVFVQYCDKKFIPKQFYDSQRDEQRQHRVKLIFIHNVFIHNQNILYIKYNEIDPVIKHINRVELSSRQDFCIYPSNPAGQIKWHKFVSKHKGFKPIEYQRVGEQLDEIAQRIKGKFREVYVICQKQEEDFVRGVFNHYSIKTKQTTGEKLKFWYLTEADNRSYLMPFSNIKASNINFPEDNNEQKFETAGQPIDVKANNSRNFGSTFKDSNSNSLSPTINSVYTNNLNPNYNYNSTNYSPRSNSNNFNEYQTARPNPNDRTNSNQKVSSSKNRESRSRNKQKNKTIEDVVQGKDFILNINQKLRDTFAVGNLYANKIQYFKNLDINNLKSLSSNQLVVTNQNLNLVKSQLQNNENVFLVYVSETLPAGKEGNSIIIRQADIQKFITDLENIQTGKNPNHLTKASNNPNNYDYHSSNTSNNTNNNPNNNNQKLAKVSSAQQLGLSNSPTNRTQSQSKNQLIPLQSLPGTLKQNLSDFKIVKLFYDNDIDVQMKKQILFAALKNKNFQPFIYKDIDTLKKMIKQENSLSLLLISKQPPNLQQELQKQNFTIVKNKRGRVIVPKFLNPTIEGLSTILEQQESQFQLFKNQQIPKQVDAFLKMMQTNPQKGRNVLMDQNYESDKNQIPSQKQQSQFNSLRQNNLAKNNKNQQNVQNNLAELQPEDWDKLNLHSNINIEGNENGNKQWIKQRLDGGVIVVFVDNNFVRKVQQIRNKINILVQQYSNTINLNNSMRQKKDKFTIVLIQSNMLPQVRTLKQQYPKTVFIYVNTDKKQIPAKDKPNISYQINKIQQFQPIIYQIYEENEKIKLGEHTKIHSKVDNKKTSYVDNGNSWRLSTGYQNNRVKNAFVFLKQEKNKNLLKKLQNMGHITLVPYKDYTDAQKKFNSYSGYQAVIIANDNDIPAFQDYVLKKKQQAYLIKLNQPEDYRQNPKIKKNILLSAFSQDEIANYLIMKFGQNINVDKNQQRPKQGKNYAPRYQPNMFGTTPRFTSGHDYVPYKNDPIYSSRGIKSLSRESKVIKTDGNINRQISPKNAQNSYYHR